MKIKTVSLRNFRSFESEDIHIPESGLCALVGENNGGKSNILSAINMALGDRYPMPDMISENDFFGRKKDKLLIIGIEFQPNESGVDAVKIVYDYSRPGTEDWKYVLKKNGQWSTYRPRSDERETFGIIYIGPERDLMHQLSYSNFTLFGRISNELQESFRNNPDYVSRSSELETNFTTSVEILRNNSKLLEFEEKLGKAYKTLMDGGVGLEFKAFDPVNYFRSLILSIEENGSSIYPRDLGMGSRNLLFIALFKAYAETFKRTNDLIIVEEPELYLHYSWRSYLYDIFRTLSENGAQIIYSTHSEDFVCLDRFDEVRIVTKSIKGTKSYSRVLFSDVEAFLNERKKDVAGATLQSTREHLGKLGLAEKSARKAFFSKKIVLVEGPTETQSLPIFLKSCDKELNFDKRNITIVDCSGKNNIPTFLSLYRSFGIDPYVIWDSDQDLSIKTRGVESNKKLSEYVFGSTEEFHSPNQSERGSVWQNNFEDMLKGEIKDYDALITKGAKEWGYDLAKDSSKQMKVKYVATKLSERGECPTSIKNIFDKLIPTP